MSKSPPVTLEELRAFRPQINEIAWRRGIGDVREFRSIARGDARPDSDVDFLVQVEPAGSILAGGGFLDEVSELIGKAVHVVTAKSLTTVVINSRHPLFLEEWLRQKH
jgi:predicted nucleotidyltransferase